VFSQNHLTTDCRKNFFLDLVEIFLPPPKSGRPAGRDIKDSIITWHRRVPALWIDSIDELFTAYVDVLHVHSMERVAADGKGIRFLK
jgi:hypothetical protein